METYNLLAATHPAFRELAEYVWNEHLKRRPAIDEQMKPLRLKAWHTWNNNLDADDPRKDRMPPKLLEGGNIMSQTQNQNKHVSQFSAYNC